MHMRYMKKTCDLSIGSMKRHRLDRGFGALVAILLLAGGTLAVSASAIAAACVYADIVDRKIERVQRGLDDVACEDSRKLILAKDAFVHGEVRLKEFGCVLSFD